MAQHRQTDRQTDSPCLCQSAAGRQEIKDKTERRYAGPGVWGCPQELRTGDPGSARCLAREVTGVKAEEDGVSFGIPGQAQRQLGFTRFPSATSVPLWPAGPGLQTHTTALFTSTPLLLCEEVMGYSATPVPFSSFLSGFLGGEAGTGMNDQ